MDLTRFVFFGDGESAGSAKYHQIKQGVGTQSVSTVDTGTGSLTTGIQSPNHLVLSTGMSDHLMGNEITGMSLCWRHCQSKVC